MADNQPDLQQSLDELSGKAAAEAESAADINNSVGRIGGEIAAETDMIEVDNPPENEEPASQPEAAPEEDLIFGKYKRTGKDGLGEAEKGYFEAANALTSERTRAAQLQTQLDQAMGLLSQNQAPTQPSAPKVDPLKQLEELGIPSDAINAAIENRMAERDQKVWGPVMAEMQAEQHMLENVDGYTGDVSAKVRKWVSTQPGVKALVDAAKAKGEHTLAAEWQLMKYNEANGAEIESALKANGAVAEEIKEKARKDAGIIKGKSAASRSTSKKDGKYIDREEFDKLRQLSNQGYPTPLLRRTISEGLPDEFFN